MAVRLCGHGAMGICRLYSSLIRAGLEGYKGLVIEGLLVPMLVVSIASFGSGLLARLFAPLSMAAAPAPTE